MPWDIDLTPAQITAATHLGSHARLLAGPGTGKTTALVRRIGWLITEHSVSPREIVALTFTRVAAAELRHELKKRLETADTQLPHVSTMHSYALSQLLRHSESARVPLPLRIADDYEERSVIHEEIKKLAKKKDVHAVERLFNELSADWDRLSPEWEAKFDPEFIGAWKEHKKIYGYTLRSELVYQMKIALEEEDFKIEAVTKYLLVDEYQDLNACDLAVIRSLAMRGAELFVSGDDDQSIYGFRYADPEGIRQFPNQYQPSTSLTLDICQRCDKAVLEYALNVAKQDTRRIDKPIAARPEAGIGTVQVLKFQNQFQEAAGIASLGEWLIKHENVPADEIIILLRYDEYRKFSNPIRDSLLSRGVPVSIVTDPLEPVNRPAGRGFLSLLRLVLNRDDALSWRVLLGVRSNRIGAETFSKIYELARKEGIPYSEALRRIQQNPNLIRTQGAILAIEMHNVEEILKKWGTPTENNLEGWLLTASEEVISDIREREEVSALLKRVIETSGAKTLGDLLRALTVSLGDKEQEREKNKVSIMTMHHAKGLSADAVIIAAAEDEYIPGRAKGEAIDDERRLLFVSLSRARHYLFITFCHERLRQQTHSGRNPGKRRRHLTNFLSGGPHRPINSQQYIQNLTSTAD